MSAPMNILVTLDRNYLHALYALLKSIFNSNPDETFDVYMIHDRVPESDIQRLEAFCAHHESRLFPLESDPHAFAQAPESRYITRPMYYRLLAFDMLPDTLSRVLYLDPDTLVINPLRPLYDMEMGAYLFAGAMRIFVAGIPETINRMRLDNAEMTSYVNSGVLLLNLSQLRQSTSRKELMDYIERIQGKPGMMLLPDQDILNGLYGDRILPIDDTLYNYEAHSYKIYHMLSGGEKDLSWVMENTVILHFCGKVKPWMKTNRSRFGILHRHYAKLAEHVLRDLDESRVVTA